MKKITALLKQLCASFRKSPTTKKCLEKNEKIGRFGENDKTTFGRPSIFESVRQPTNKFNWIMSLLSSKNGFRGEYLARYIVSRFAFISESSVGEDYGIDFYCGLSKEIENDNGIKLVKYDKPFLLQIKTKTTSRGKRPKSIILKEEHQINTLFNLETPFFVGFLDLTTKILEIYSTSSMWYPFILNKGDIKKVTLKFGNKKKTDLNKPFNSEFVIDLGNPIISIDAANIENSVDSCRDILSTLIDFELENLISKKLSLSYFRWAYEYETNKYESFKYGYKFVNKGDDSSYLTTTQDMLNSLHPYLVSLALSAKNERKSELYKNIIKVTQEINNDLKFEDLIDKFGEIYDSNIDYDYSDNGDLSEHIPTITSGYTEQHIIQQSNIIQNLNTFAKSNYIKPKSSKIKPNTKSKGRK